MHTEADRRGRVRSRLNEGEADKGGRDCGGDWKKRR